MPYTPIARTIDPALVDVLITPPLNPAPGFPEVGRLSGYGSDVVVTSTDSNDVDDEPGADGEVVSWLTNDRRATVIVNLQPTSRSNLLLSNLRNFHLATGLGFFGLSIFDQRVGDRFIGAQCVVQKMPDNTKQKGAAVNAWPIRVFNVVAAFGGSQV